MKTTKKLLAILLAMLMVLSSFAIAVNAASSVTLDISNGKIVITDSGYSIAGGSQTNFTGDYIIVGSTTNSDNYVAVNNNASVTITLSNLNIDFSSYGSNRYIPIDLLSAGSCTLILDGTSTLKGGYDAPAIMVPSNNKTTVTGSGKLNAFGGRAWPGIGKQYGGGNIEINGCTVNAVGGLNSSGIGGSWGASAGDVRIVDAIVYARSGFDGSNSSGIGAGYGHGENVGTIKIENSYVTSQTSSKANDTLQNKQANCVTSDNITISGSSVVNGTYFNNAPAYHSHNGVNYEPWVSTDSLPSAGNYVLTNDIVLTDPWSVSTTAGATRLCLNGYGVRSTGNAYMIQAFEGSDLTIEDCGTNVINKITLNNYRGTAAERVASKGTDTINASGTGDVYINGGYFTGGTYDWGSAIRVTSGVTINGGTFIGNTSNAAGAIRVNAGGILTLNGGQIIYNRSSSSVSDGGAINEEGGGQIRFSGNPVVKNNYDTDGNARNVNLRNGMTTLPKVVAQLQNGAEIGITMQSNTGVFTASENTSNNDASKFFSDKTKYSLKKNNSGQLEIYYDPANADPAHYEVDGNTVTIKDADGWNTFCDILEGNAQGFYTGKTVKMGSSFKITRMAGNDTHKFTGTFDGNKKTLTANITKNNWSDNCAPFAYADGATFRNLKVNGTLTTNGMFAASIVARNYGTTKIINCISSVTIDGAERNGDGTHGGFVGVNESGATLNFTGCVFNGSMVGANTNSCGGFIGWANNSVSYTNCLFVPGAMDIGAYASSTFHRGSASTTYKNAYFTTPFNGITTQGKQARSITAGDDVTITFSVPAATYDVSGITAFVSGEYGAGIMYSGVYYAGDGDQVPMTLGYNGTLPTGYHCEYSETLTNGKLTMPDRNVVISAAQAINTYTITWKNADGTPLKEDTDISHGTSPVYNGATPTKASDTYYDYTFSGWTDGENTYGLSNTLPAVTGDVTYTATFTAIPNAPEVSVTGTSRVISEPELDAQSGKYVATVQADMQNAAGDYFVYWIDGNGNIIGSYRTYRFYVFGDTTLTPVYASQEQYYTERAKAETASRMADIKVNDGTVTLYGEHSVSSGKGITGHGIIVTTDAADKDTLDVDNCENNFAARTTANTLTGILEVTAAIGANADTLWARTYVIDGAGEYHYGSVAEYALSGAGPDSLDETVMLDSAEFSVDQQAETEEINTDEPAAESTLTTIINMIIEIVMQIVSIVKSALAIVK